MQVGPCAQMAGITPDACVQKHWVTFPLGPSCVRLQLPGCAVPRGSTTEVWQLQNGQTGLCILELPSRRCPRRAAWNHSCGPPDPTPCIGHRVLLASFHCMLTVQMSRKIGSSSNPFCAPQRLCCLDVAYCSHSLQCPLLHCLPVPPCCNTWVLYGPSLSSSSLKGISVAVCAVALPTVRLFLPAYATGPASHPLL